MFPQDERGNNTPQYSEKRSASSRLPWLLAGILGALVAFQYFGAGNSLNGFEWSALLGLLCPLMMVYMMFSHNHHSGGGDDKSGSGGCCGGQHQQTQKPKD